jgi:hypothetical protein
VPFPTNVQENDLSTAWLEALKKVLAARKYEVTPLVVSISGFGDNYSIPENLAVRDILDKFLVEHGEQECHTVANTIFPIRMYQQARYDRKQLFTDFNLIYERIREANKKLNSRGIYFGRMTSGNGGEADNQLDYIIDRFNDRGPSGLRRSALQVSIFRPAEDHKSGHYLGFPCLQHLSIVPDTQKNTLVLNAFYAQQDIVRKAYGNYLGLCNLAAFLSREMSLKVDTVNCFIGTEKIEAKDVTVTELRALVASIESVLTVASNN